LCACVAVLPSCVGTVGVNNRVGTSDSMPSTDVELVSPRSDGASAILYPDNVWEWCGVTVPIVRDFRSGHVLKTAMVFLLWKYGRGAPFALRVSSWGENRMLRRWMGGFGQSHTMLEFDEEEAMVV
jgi:hypothetical protein